MERDCEKDCLIFNALLYGDRFLADLNRAAKIAKREGREFDGSAESMCGGCAVRGEINNAIEEKIQALVRK